MTKMKLKCLTSIVYGYDDEKVFLEGGYYDARKENGLYHIEINGVPIIALEKLYRLFTVTSVEINREEESEDFIFKDKVCQNLDWKDFSIENVPVLTTMVEKVGVGQYSIKYPMTQIVQLEFETFHNDRPLKIKSSYREILRMLELSHKSVMVVKLKDSESGRSLNIDPEFIRKPYEMEIIGFYY